MLSVAGLEGSLLGAITSTWQRFWLTAGLDLSQLVSGFRVRRNEAIEDQTARRRSKIVQLLVLGPMRPVVDAVVLRHW